MVNLTDIIDSPKTYYDEDYSCWIINNGAAAFMFGNDPFSIREEAICFFAGYHKVIYVPINYTII